MTPDSDVPTASARLRWFLQEVVRRGRSNLGPGTARVLLAASITLLAVMLVLTGYYFHYSHLIDKQLEGGPFRNSINIYGAPTTLNQGDSPNPGELEEEFRMAGYSASAQGKPGSFARTSSGWDVKPLVSDGHADIRIVLGPKKEIKCIEADGNEVKTWNIGYPLLENLSPGREKRQMITYRQIPPVLVHAIVSAEDKHFFQHAGLDLPRVAKAAYVDVRQRRKDQGASTLTMQLVRGLLLVPEKSFHRKFAEAMMTIHLERQWSKEEILAAYANMVFLGTHAAYNIHGFAGGSRLFFDKDLRNINLSEAALLAGMVQRPSYFNPYRNPEHAKARRDLVLSLMRDNKYISDIEYRQAVESPLTVVKPGERVEPLGAAYFLDMVRNDLQRADQPEDRPKTVYTTIDLNLQSAALEAIRSGMSEVDKLLTKRLGKHGPPPEAALIALDPRTGEIKALVGGRDYASSQLNRVFAKRPPGSVFKPFVYAAALNTGLVGGDQILTAASTVNDDPVALSFNNEVYQPANFRHETFGNLTFRQALAKSNNIAAVRVAQLVGLPQVVTMARSAGLNSDIQPTPSVALGSYAVTPFEMAGAYTAFANSGTWSRPHIVSYVQDVNGNTIHDERDNTRRAMDPRIAYLMTNMLEEVMRSGTAAGVRSRGFLAPAAGKTGTSHDGWFAGYTSQLLCIVWVGFDDYRELNLEGARSALPIWAEFMKKASRLSAYRDAHEFTQPGGISSAKICVDSGKLAGNACTRTTNEVFIAGTEPKDMCDQHPAMPPLLPVQLVPEIR